MRLSVLECWNPEDRIQQQMVGAQSKALVLWECKDPVYGAT